MLDAEIVANNSVDAGAAIVQFVIGQNNQDGILSLLATNEHGVSAEKLECVHGGFGQGDNAVIVVDGIGDPCQVSRRNDEPSTNIART